MSLGQVVRPEHCGPMALPPCTTLTNHCPNSPEAVLPVLGTRTTLRRTTCIGFAHHPGKASPDGSYHRGVAHAFHSCDVAVREPVMIQTTPTAPTALARRPDTAGPLAVATPTTRRLADASISRNTRRAYAGALARLDARAPGESIPAGVERAADAPASRAAVGHNNPAWIKPKTWRASRS